MKVAARFPVKTFAPLYYAILVFHGLLCFISLNLFGWAWQQILLGSSLLISLYFSNKQYQKITQSPDDLCWNSDGWLMHQGNKLKGAIYLKLQPSSWVSAQLCLLHFCCDEVEYHWLFSRYELGERAYSQLVYLARQNLRACLKDEPGA